MGKIGVDSVLLCMSMLIPKINNLFLQMVKEVNNMIATMVLFINELGVYGGTLGILAYIILMERLKRKSVTAEAEKLFKYVITHSTA